jgi:tungstate transport system substrate-binding protein
MCRFNTGAWALAMALIFGCSKSSDKVDEQHKSAGPAKTITLATTTSTDNSGLLKALLPVFKARSKIDVKVIAVGTGKAIKLGENGDVDVILAHAKSAEEKFVADGFGLRRVAVMYNDFVILGPNSDSAKIKGCQTAAKALQKIAEAQAPFISRGDDSGTHKKEKELWQLAGVKPGGAWYILAGQGMGAVLNMTDEKNAYTVADRGTFIAYNDKVRLQVLYEGAKVLFNPYSVIAVNPRKHAHVKAKEAQMFIDFLVSAEGQKIIGDFKVKGKQLFIPAAVK